MNKKILLGSCFLFPVLITMANDYPIELTDGRQFVVHTREDKKLANVVKIFPTRVYPSIGVPRRILFNSDVFIETSSGDEPRRIRLNQFLNSLNLPPEHQVYVHLLKQMFLEIQAYLDSLEEDFGTGRIEDYTKEKTDTQSKLATIRQLIDMHESSSLQPGLKAPNSFGCSCANYLDVGTQ